MSLFASPLLDADIPVRQYNSCTKGGKHLQQQGVLVVFSRHFLFDPLGEMIQFGVKPPPTWGETTHLCQEGLARAQHGVPETEIGKGRKVELWKDTSWLVNVL